MRIITWLLAVLAAALYICTPLRDPDMWWHITIGRWIVAHRDVPKIDLWNRFSDGSIFRAYSWSAEVVMAIADRLGGAQALMMLQLGLAIFFSIFVALALAKLAGNYAVGMALAVGAILACSNHFSLRPQVLTWILFLSCILVADRIARGGASVKSLLTLIILGSFWANLHITTCLGALAVALWSVQGSSSGISLKRASISTLAFLAGSFITPYLGGEWLTFLYTGQHTIDYSEITEFKPPTIREPSLLLASLTSIILIPTAFIRRTVPLAGQLLHCLIMLCAGLLAVKFMPYGVLALYALAANMWREYAASSNNQATQSLNPITIWATALISLVLITVSGNKLLKAGLIDTANVPVAAVDFIQAKNLPHPILNDFNTGGYLMYRLSDPSTGELKHKVPIDGRTNINSEDIWSSQKAAMSGKPSWYDYIEKTQAETILWEQEWPLGALLILSPDWCRVFRTSPDKEEGFSVFVKRQYYESRKTELLSSDCAG
jgi:hypothetical protein